MIFGWKMDVVRFYFEKSIIDVVHKFVLLFSDNSEDNFLCSSLGHQVFGKCIMQSNLCAWSMMKFA